MGSIRRQLSVRTMLATWLLLAFCASLLVFNAAWVLSEAYSAHARQLIQSKQYGKVPLKASGLAVLLSPANAAHHLNHAYLLASYRLTDEAAAEFKRALRISPADPGLWQAFVHFKIFLGEYDREMEHGISRVYQLAPNDLGLHLDNAYLAMRHWNTASQPIKDSWAASIERVIGEKTMATFLQLVLQNAQEELLCREPKFSRLNIGWWCYWALQARQICFSPRRTHEQADWCRKHGLTEDARR